MGRRTPRRAVDAVVRLSFFIGFLEVYLSFGFLRTLADNAGMPVERTVLPAVDRTIGLGMTPGQRLQSLFYPGHVTAFDRFFLGVYDSWLIVPIILTAYIILCHWDLVYSYALVRLGAYFIALPFYFLMPSEPPWMAIHGLRIVTVLTGKTPGDTNLVAAFPSMHVLVPAALACWLWSKRMTVMAVVFSIFTGLTAFAVLYLGEHYLVDVLASLVLAFLLVRFGAWAERKIARSSSATTTSVVFTSPDVEAWRTAA